MDAARRVPMDDCHLVTRPSPPAAQSVDSGGRSGVKTVAQPRPRFFEA
jgi:hypothetical protein